MERLCGGHNDAFRGFPIIPKKISTFTTRATLSGMRHFQEFTQKCIKQQIIQFTAGAVLFIRLLCVELCLTGKHTILYLPLTLLYTNIKQQLSCSSINIVH